MKIDLWRFSVPHGGTKKHKTKNKKNETQTKVRMVLLRASQSYYKFD